MEEKFEVNFSNLRIDQISYVYRDIKKQARLLEDIYYVPRFRFIEARGGFIRFRGKKTQISVKIGLGRIFNTEVELIEWIDGECAFKEFLDEGRDGLHHIGTFVEDYEGYLDYFKGKGIGVLQYGRDITRWAYLDSEESFGIILEILEIRKRIRKK